MRVVYPSHYFHQELARAKYADMLREARMIKIEAALKADLDAPPGRLRRILIRRRPSFVPRPAA